MITEPIVSIVDDDPAARDSVAALVRSKGVNVETFTSAEEFLSSFDVSRTGCLVVDVRMAGMNGLELQDALNARKSTLPVIVITGFGDVPTAVRAMKAGAVTFLEKPCQAQELWAVIQRALGDSLNRTQQVTRDSEIQARFDRLTIEERRIMQMMLDGKTNKAIASELDLGLRTVELRRSNIMKKMQAQNFADLVRLSLVAQET
jgi:FixJ family two-component response regulator